MYSEEDKMTDLNVVSINIDEENKENSYLLVKFTDDSEEVVPCDFFGTSEQLPDFITVFTDEKADLPNRFYNSKYIRSMKVLKESEIT